MREIDYFQSVSELTRYAYSEVVIYGAGKRGRDLFQELQKTAVVEVKGFLDTYCSGEVEGLPVYRLGDAPDEFISSPLLVASLYHMEIIKLLYAGGRRNFHVQVLDSYEKVPFKIFERFCRTGGSYVEAGANDGMLFSNTFLLERFAGWKGMLVEPLPAAAAACRRNRPDSLVEECALGRCEGQGRLTDHGLMSNLQSAGDSEQQGNLHTVRVKTLSQLLDVHNFDSIDLLVLDVEGAEAEVLRGLDMERHKPRYILLEEQTDDARRRNLRELGGEYRFLERLSPRDSLYCRNE